MKTTNWRNLALILLATACSANAANVITETFDDVAGLTGTGWIITNNSNPVGPTSWFQGNPGVFSSHSGAANSFAAANLNATGLVGDISVWLISPVLNFNDGDVISFYTRTLAPVDFADNLEVRLSLSGASSSVGSTAASVGDFTSLLLTINPTLDLNGYPTDWTLFTATVSGLGATTPGRLAFRYAVPNGGELGSNSNFIGVDTLSVDAVPEPATWLAGLGLAAVVLRKSTKK